MQYRLCVVVATLLACGSTSSFVDDAGGPDAYGHKSFDSAVVDQTSPFGDVSQPETSGPPSCGEVDTNGFTPTWPQSWKPPAAFGQNRCSLTQINDYLGKCLYSGASDPSACATKLSQSGSLDCFTCLAPGTSSDGPLSSAKGPCGEKPSFNIGGCLSNALDSSCASAWMNANDCAEIACSTCYLCGGGEDIPDFVHPCVAGGGNPSCSNVRAAAACALSSTSPTVKACLAMLEPGSWSDYTSFTNLFCGPGPGPSDAGTD